jgi:hypothetical protein
LGESRLGSAFRSQDYVHEALRGSSLVSGLGQ